MIQQSNLRALASYTTALKTDRVLEEARRYGGTTAFLCHSHKDADLARGVQAFLQKHGWIVYIDWQDASMPETPNRETARKIKDRIKTLHWFLFLATNNSMASRWCPWETGYADGVKGVDRVIIIPTQDDNGRTHGNEYLQLYRRIALSTGGDFGVFEPDGKGTLLRNM